MLSSDAKENSISGSVSLNACVSGPLVRPCYSYRYDPVGLTVAVLESVCSEHCSVIQSEELDSHTPRTEEHPLCECSFTLNRCLSVFLGEMNGPHVMLTMRNDE